MINFNINLKIKTYNKNNNSYIKKNLLNYLKNLKF